MADGVNIVEWPVRAVLTFSSGDSPGAAGPDGLLRPFYGKRLVLPLRFCHKIGFSTQLLSHD